MVSSPYDALQQALSIQVSGSYSPYDALQQVLSIRATSSSSPYDPPPPGKSNQITRI